MSFQKNNSFYIRNFNYNQITFIFNVINYCNFNCEYCCENCNIITNNYLLLDFQKIFFFIKKIIKQTNKKIIISIYGGEPTLHPGLLEFCEKIYLLYPNITIEVFSNFSANILLYEKLLSYNVQLILTYHYYSALKINLNFIDKLKLINFKFLKNISIYIMLEQQYIDILFNTYNVIFNYFKSLNKLRKSQIMIKIIRSTDIFNSKYSIQNKLKFNQFIDKLDSKYFLEFIYNNNIISHKNLEKINCLFKYWICSAGVTSYYINVYGNIYACQSKEQNEKIFRKKMIIGNILNDFILKTKYTLCQSDLCTDYDSKKINILNLKQNLF